MELIYFWHNLTDSVGSGKCTEGSSSSEESWPPGRNPHRPWPCWLPRCKREGKGGMFCRWTWGLLLRWMSWTWSSVGTATPSSSLAPLPLRWWRRWRAITQPMWSNLPLEGLFLLYRSPSKNNDQSQSQYPLDIQVYKYSKYLGDMRLNFDSSGELLTPVAGVGVSRAEVVLLNDAFPQDPWIEAQLEEYRDLLSDYYPPVGWSEVLLETRRDNTESNLGNLITGILRYFT